MNEKRKGGSSGPRGFEDIHVRFNDFRATGHDPIPNQIKPLFGKFASQNFLVKSLAESGLSFRAGGPTLTTQ